MQTQNPRCTSHAIVCGAGIGGLTTALCLAQAGWQVTVLEQAPQIKEVGAGIQLSPNAMRVLSAIGLEPDLVKHGFLPKALQMRHGSNGNVIAELALDTVHQQPWNGRYINIHRADLIQLLCQAVQQQPLITVKLGTKVSAYLQSSDGVVVTTTQQGELAADLLVGADGIHSVIREQLFGKHTPRFTGNRAWRLTVATEKLGQNAPPETACVWFGDNKHAVTYRLRQGKETNFVGVVESDRWVQESWSYQGSKQDALNDFAGWHPAISTIIEKADQHFQWALMDRPVLKQWFEQRTVLVGDACHSMLPFMAQGAAMAIEDAMVLSRCLTKLDTTPALARYQALRQTRTEKVWQLANKNAALYHQHGKLRSKAQQLKLGIGSRFLPKIAANQFHWLYSYDAKTIDI